jgi:S-adenosylmethionine:tRNA ribosyltransferase-isomerase
MPLNAAPAPIPPSGAKLLVLAKDGTLTHAARRDLARCFSRGDVVVANDAVTLPASLSGTHVPTGAPIEVRLAGIASLEPAALRTCRAVVFGAGDFRMRTEDRAPPPLLSPGDRLALGPLVASVAATMGHPRWVSLSFEASTEAIWAGIARHGRPIQYAHVAAPLALWEVWTPIAGRPVAFEPPSAGFALDWQTLAAMRARGVIFATLTHAAGISSTGDPALDAHLPFDEPYSIPSATVRAIGCARARSRRVIAVGTTVVRALEHAASRGTLRPGNGVATQRIVAGTRLSIVDAVLSGTHEPGSSHYELLRAFADDGILRRAVAELESRGYRTHEFGDSVLIERQATNARGRAPLPALAA